MARLPRAPVRQSRPVADHQVASAFMFRGREADAVLIECGAGVLEQVEHHVAVHLDVAGRAVEKEIASVPRILQCVRSAMPGDLVAVLDAGVE